MRNIIFYRTKESAKEAQKHLAKQGLKATIFRMSKSERQIYNNIYYYYIRYGY